MTDKQIIAELVEEAETIIEAHRFAVSKNMNAAAMQPNINAFKEFIATARKHMEGEK